MQPTQPWQDPANCHRNRPTHYCILGATAMDVGAAAAQRRRGRIHWVMPRDSRFMKRLVKQPGEACFEHAIGERRRQMQALADATGVDDLVLRLEAAGLMLRIDHGQLPRMFHYATVCESEVLLRRQISRVIRLGRVQAANCACLEAHYDDAVKNRPGTPAPFSRLMVGVAGSAPLH